MTRFYPEAYHPEETEETRGETPEGGIQVERAETGETVTVRAFLTRHGKRPANQIKPETEMTEDGKKECIELGNRIGKSPVIGGECSCRNGRDGKKIECVRTKETAQLMVYGSRAEDKRPVEEREELSSHASEEFREKVREYVKKVLLEKNPGLTEEELNQMDLLSTVEGIDFYLNCKEEDWDAQTYSPLETAASVALRINAVMKEKTKEVKSDSAMDYILATHDYVIAAFLQQVLIWKAENGQTKRGFSSLAELGDRPIEFLENLAIVIKTDNKGNPMVKTGENGNKTIDAVFRDRMCAIDMDRLYELVEIGNQLEQNRANKK